MKEVFKSKINWLVSFIDTAPTDERPKLADEIHEVYTRMESNGRKKLMRSLENYARSGETKKPTSVAAEVRQ